MSEGASLAQSILALETDLRKRDIKKNGVISRSDFAFVMLRHGGSLDQIDALIEQYGSNSSENGSSVSSSKQLVAYETILQSMKSLASPGSTFGNVDSDTILEKHESHAHNHNSHLLSNQTLGESVTNKSAPVLQSSWAVKSLSFADEYSPPPNLPTESPEKSELSALRTTWQAANAAVSRRMGRSEENQARFSSGVVRTESTDHSGYPSANSRVDGSMCNGDFSSPSAPRADSFFESGRHTPSMDRTVTPSKAVIDYAVSRAASVSTCGGKKRCDSSRETSMDRENSLERGDQNSDTGSGLHMMLGSSNSNFAQSSRTVPKARSCNVEKMIQVARHSYSPPSPSGRVVEYENSKEPRSTSSKLTTHAVQTRSGQNAHSMGSLSPLTPWDKPNSEHGRDGDSPGYYPEKGTAVSLRDVFRCIDSDGDQRVTLEEVFHAFSRRELGVSWQELEALADSIELSPKGKFHAGDRCPSNIVTASDADGSFKLYFLTVADFCTIISRLRASTVERIRKCTLWAPLAALQHAASMQPQKRATMATHANDELLQTPTAQVSRRRSIPEKALSSREGNEYLPRREAGHAIGTKWNAEKDLISFSPPPSVDVPHPLSFSTAESLNTRLAPDSELRGGANVIGQATEKNRADLEDQLSSLSVSPSPLKENTHGEDSPLFSASSPPIAPSKHAVSTAASSAASASGEASLTVSTKAPGVATAKHPYYVGSATARNLPMTVSNGDENSEKQHAPGGSSHLERLSDIHREIVERRRTRLESLAVKSSVGNVSISDRTDGDTEQKPDSKATYSRLIAEKLSPSPANPVGNALDDEDSTRHGCESQCENGVKFGDAGEANREDSISETERAFGVTMRGRKYSMRSDLGTQNTEISFQQRTPQATQSEGEKEGHAMPHGSSSSAGGSGLSGRFMAPTKSSLAQSKPKIPHLASAWGLHKSKNVSQSRSPSAQMLRRGGSQSNESMQRSPNPVSRDESPAAHAPIRSSTKYSTTEAPSSQGVSKSRSYSSPSQVDLILPAPTELCGCSDPLQENRQRSSSSEGRGVDTRSAATPSASAASQWRSSSANKHTKNVPPAKGAGTGAGDRSKSRSVSPGAGNMPPVVRVALRQKHPASDFPTSSLPSSSVQAEGHVGWKLPNENSLPEKSVRQQKKASGVRDGVPPLSRSQPSCDRETKSEKQSANALSDSTKGSMTAKRNDDFTKASRHFAGKCAALLSLCTEKDKAQQGYLSVETLRAQLHAVAPRITDELVEVLLKSCWVENKDMPVWLLRSESQTYINNQQQRDTVLGMCNYAQLVGDLVVGDSTRTKIAEKEAEEDHHEAPSGKFEPHTSSSEQPAVVTEGGSEQKRGASVLTTPPSNTTGRSRRLNIQRKDVVTTSRSNQVENSPSPTRIVSFAAGGEQNESRKKPVSASNTFPSPDAMEMEKLYETLRSRRAQRKVLLRGELMDANHDDVRKLRNYFFAEDDIKTGYVEEKVLVQIIQAMYTKGKKTDPPAWVTDQIVQLCRTPFQCVNEDGSVFGENTSTRGHLETVQTWSFSDAERAAKERAKRIPKILHHVLCDYRFLLEELEL